MNKNTKKPIKQEYSSARNSFTLNTPRNQVINLHNKEIISPLIL